MYGSRPPDEKLLDIQVTFFPEVDLLILRSGQTPPHTLKCMGGGLSFWRKYYGSRPPDEKLLDIQVTFFPEVDLLILRSGQTQPKMYGRKPNSIVSSRHRPVRNRIREGSIS